jgi:hypothetical protein
LADKEGYKGETFVVSASCQIYSGTPLLASPSKFVLIIEE